MLHPTFIPFRGLKTPPLVCNWWYSCLWVWYGGAGGRTSGTSRLEYCPRPPGKMSAIFSTWNCGGSARVADPVHFWQDPDPANQNFKNQIRILLALTKNQFEHQNFFHINQICSDIWMVIFFIWKNGKIHLKMCKSSIFKIFFPYLYYFTLPKYW